MDHGADVNLPCGLTDADINSVDGARCIGSGALNEACRIGCVSLVQLLFQRGAIDLENVALATAFKVWFFNHFGRKFLLFMFHFSTIKIRW